MDVVLVSVVCCLVGFAFVSYARQSELSLLSLIGNVLRFFCWLFGHIFVIWSLKTKTTNCKNTMCELIKRRQRNDKTRFSCFHDAKIQHRKSSFWTWVGFVAKKLGKSVFGGFRWVSAFIIYIYNIYILYLYEERPVPAKGLKCQKSKLT